MILSVSHTARKKELQKKAQATKATIELENNDDDI
jgi:hypothetical protein